MIDPTEGEACALGGVAARRDTDAVRVASRFTGDLRVRLRYAAVDERIDGWYRAEGSRATFAFLVAHGRVIKVAPYGRRWLHGKTWAEAWETLHAQGYEVARL